MALTQDKLGSISYYPHAFLKKRRGYCNRLCPSVCLSFMLSPPKPLDEIQPNLLCELLTWMGRDTALFLAPSRGLSQTEQMHKLRWNASIFIVELNDLIQNYQSLWSNQCTVWYDPSLFDCWIRCPYPSVQLLLLSERKRRKTNN